MVYYQIKTVKSFLLVLAGATRFPVYKLKCDISHARSAIDENRMTSTNLTPTSLLDHDTISHTRCDERWLRNDNSMERVSERNLSAKSQNSPVKSQNSSIGRRKLSLTASLDRHYEMNNQVLLVFEESYRRGIDAVAYQFGKQFVETALFEIPRHGYFNSKRHEEDKARNSLDALRVSDMLDLMLDGDHQEGMDVEDKLRDDVLSLKVLVQNQAKEDGMLDKYLLDRSNILEEVKSGDNVTADRSLSGAMIEWIESIKNKACHGGSGELYFGEGVCVEDWYSRLCIPRGSQREFSSFQPIAVATHVTEEDSCEDEEKRNFLLRSCLPSQAPYARGSGGSIEPPRSESSIANSDYLPISSLTQCYVEDFEQLRNRGVVAVYYLATFQGKYPESINGCTVIAPLLAIHHFHHGENTGDMIPDSLIEEVIDIQAPTILPQVRSDLGLTPNALIIPSDAHDYLLAHSLLSPEQFVDTCGGDILSTKHLGLLMKMLEQDMNGKKLAATLFFHEHVICILKQLRPNGDVWYDLVDSLPSSRDNFENQSTLDEVRGYPITEEEAYTFDEKNDESLSAVRIRCKTLESLEATIRWYSCLKFTDENRVFIDSYQWDDMNSNFDPRVFQAFIWTEA